MKLFLTRLLLLGPMVVLVFNFSWAGVCDRMLLRHGVSPFLQKTDFMENKQGFISATSNGFAWGSSSDTPHVSYYTESAAHLEILRRTMGERRLAGLLNSDRRDAISNEVKRMREKTRLQTPEEHAQEENRLSHQVINLAGAPLPDDLYQDILLHLERIGLYAPSFEEYLAHHGLPSNEAQSQLKWIRVYILQPGREQTELILFAHRDLPLVQPHFMHEDIVLPLLRILSNRRLDFRLTKNQTESLVGTIHVSHNQVNGNTTFTYYDHLYRIDQTSNHALPIESVAPRGNHPLLIDLSLLRDF